MPTYYEPLYQKLAGICDAAIVCHNSKGREHWHQLHIERACKLVADNLPCGSGFDNGTQLDFDMSHQNRLVFTTAFHHMDACGSYDGWSEHAVQISASLRDGIKVTVTGVNMHDIKDYIAECFQYSLTRRFDNNDVIEVQVEDNPLVPQTPSLDFNLGDIAAQARGAA